MADRAETVCQIRAFNRFYTVLQGFLNRNYLDSGYSVTETRILFELRQRGQLSASDLTGMLHLDKGYISRLVRSFEQKEMVVRQVSAQDGRALLIQLTPKGQQEADRLIDVTNRRLDELIQPLTPEDCDNLCAAMETIRKSFSGNKKEDMYGSDR